VLFLVVTVTFYREKELHGAVQKQCGHKSDLGESPFRSIQMKEDKLISIALRFNEMINSRDLTGLSVLMTEDHTFIDISNRVHKGRDSMIVG